MSRWLVGRGRCRCDFCVESANARKAARAPRISDHPYGECERGEVHDYDDYDPCDCDVEMDGDAYETLLNLDRGPLRAKLIEF